MSTILFIFQGGSYIYFILLAPIVVVLLSKIFKRKDLLLHIIISCFLIFIFVNPYFVQDKQEIEKRNLVIDDLKTISDDFDFDAAVFDRKTFAMFFIWDKNLPFFVSVDEYNKVMQGDDYYTNYAFEVEPKIDTSKIFEFKTGMKINIKEDVDYENLPWILEKGQTPPEVYSLTECYDILCVYQKIIQ